MCSAEALWVDFSSSNFEYEKSISNILSIPLAQYACMKQWNAWTIFIEHVMFILSNGFIHLWMSKKFHRCVRSQNKCTLLVVARRTSSNDRDKIRTKKLWVWMYLSVGRIFASDWKFFDCYKSIDLFLQSPFKCRCCECISHRNRYFKNQRKNVWSL